MGTGLQSTKRENTHNSNLLFFRKLETFQRGHRVYNDHDIGEDMDSGIREPKTLLAQTESLDGAIPELLDGNAIAPRGDDGPGTVDGYKCNHAVTDDAHSSRSEYSQVLQENGQFRDDERCIVDWNCRPEAL